MFTQRDRYFICKQPAFSIGQQSHTSMHTDTDLGGQKLLISSTSIHSSIANNKEASFLGEGFGLKDLLQLYSSVYTRV